MKFIMQKNNLNQFTRIEGLSFINIIWSYSTNKVPRYVSVMFIIHIQNNILSSSFNHVTDVRLVAMFPKICTITVIWKIRGGGRIFACIIWLKELLMANTKIIVSYLPLEHFATV